MRIPTRSTLLLTLVTALAATATATPAQEAPTADDKLIIGTKVAPPFAFEEAGRWKGASIELWDELAKELNLEYEIRGFGEDLDDLLAAVQRGEVDAGVAAITVNGERESRMDFSHPFYTTGFGIAVRPVEKQTWKTTAATVFSWRVLRVLVVLVGILLLMGFLMWLVERRVNPEQFGGSVPNGIWSGFWWAAVTMTTVGYGDKAPRSVAGRILTVVWMLTALFGIGTFIASMSSALTVGQLGGPIRDIEDLTNARVATLEGSTSEAWLRENRIPFRHFDSPAAALEAVARGSMDAMFYDKPLLEYRVAQTMGGRVELLREDFGQQDYAIALPEGSALREPINRALLSGGIQAAWRDILFRYLKEAPAAPPRPER
ncbi:MAG: transporter substrate-binding domain-containing protein [Thermoanaerobaculia bacterium]